jgi:hypothetical protein
VNVLVVCATDYPDMDAVKARLAKGQATEHTTWIRSGDRLLKGMLDEMDGRYEVATPDKEMYGAGARVARDNMLVNDMDFIIVFHTTKSGVTKYFVDKAREYPYSLMYGKKIEVNEKAGKARRPAKRRVIE